MQCIICNQPPLAEQPAYCGHCLIPLGPITIQLTCGKCQHNLTSYESCTNCSASLIEYPPQPDDSDIPHHDAEKISQTIEELGIAHLTREDQAVALSSLAREKLHLMSGDYNHQHALMLAQMSYHMAIGVQSIWAAEMTATVLASAYLKQQQPQIAIQILTKHIPSQIQSQIQQLRALEHRAYLLLAYRMGSVNSLANHLLPIMLDDIASIYQSMEPQILEYLKLQHGSEYLGMDRKDTKIPRLDYLVSILSILMDEAIIRQGSTSPLPDDLLDRFLELDNLIYQLGRISPSDDPGYFAAQFREYMRLFNGVFWYGDVTMQNDGTRRRLVIDQAFVRLEQWIQIIPIHFLIVLRPARLFEVFLRAQQWSKIINVDILMENILKLASNLHQPKLLYIFAEAEANAQHFESALRHLALMLSETYAQHLEPKIAQMGDYLLQSIQLEQVGILLGVSRELRMGDEIKILLENRNPVKFTCSPSLAILGVAIFGDFLIQSQSCLDDIVQINNWRYDDPFWSSPASGSYSGHRMEAILVESEYKSKNIQLFFEGKNQLFQGNQLMPSELLLLRASSEQMPQDEIIQLLADILSGKSEAKIFTLKKAI